MRQSISHIALVVRDYDEAIAFFTKTLHFTLVEDTYQPEQDKRWVVVSPPGSRGTSLLLARGATPGQQAFIGNQSGGRVFLFLQTDDFWRDHAEMVSRGIKFVREPAEAPYGTVAVFEDLYGNKWDLVQLKHAPTGTGRVRFLFDYISPYAYLAWTQVEALAARCGREVEPVPVLFAGILGALGTKGPAEIPAKRDYLFKHTARIAQEFGVPFAPPPAHPFNPLLALRVTAAVESLPERRKLVSALFAAAWGGGGGVETEAQVRAAGASEALLAAAASPEVKAKVRQATDDAIAAGAFGVPTFIVDGELFFGVDSLGHLETFLRGKDTLSAEAVANWRQLPASASRKI